MGNQNRNRNSARVPQGSNEPTEQQIAKQKREMEERKTKYIANFLTTLEADDFQKEIIKQTIDSFFDEKVALFQVKYERNINFQDAIKKLEESHFKDLKELISENDMIKINEMIAGDFDEKEVTKKKKKKRKNKKKRNKEKNEDPEDNG
jgi:hypothetical protein